jgi:hypothetical protein
VEIAVPTPYSVLVDLTAEGQPKKPSNFVLPLLTGPVIVVDAHSEMEIVDFLGWLAEAAVEQKELAESSDCSLLTNEKKNWDCRTETCCKTKTE